MAKKVKFAPLDVSEHLNDEEVIAEYLSAAQEDPNSDVFLVAVANVAKARIEERSASTWSGEL